MSDYYSRNAATHIDGTPIFATQADHAAEQQVIAAVAHAFACDVKSFGPLAPIDCYATRDGRLIGVLEIKHRTHAYGTHPTVFLNTRKWLALTLANVGLGVPALYVIAWADSIRWINVSDVDASRHRIGGLTRRVKATSDIEPVIEVPVSSFRNLNNEQVAS